MSGQRDGFACLVAGILLLLVSGLGLLVVGAVAAPDVLASQRCLEDGPFPPSSRRVLEGGGVGQQWQWAPMGLRCEWHYPDGHQVTTTATSWSGTALGVGTVLGGVLGSVLVVVALARVSGTV